MNGSRILRALGHWQLEPVISVQRATTGVMNEIFIVSTGQRKVVLRKHRRPDREQVLFEHAVIEHARQRRIPTPAAIPSRAGDLVVDHDDAYYSLFSHADGEQLEHDRLTAAQARSMGAMLAGLHRALADFPVARRAAQQDSTDPIALTETITRLIDRIDQIPRPTEQDGWAREHLRTKAQWLATHPVPINQQLPQDRFQLVHGDYLHPNLFFVGTSVSAVIDWDKAEARWPVDEIIRTFDLSLKLRPELCSAMIDGYRSVLPLALDDLDRSANNWCLSELRSQWLFEGIYLRNDDRLRTLLEPGPFVPFSDHWNRLRDHLC